MGLRGTFRWIKRHKETLIRVALAVKGALKK
jgi:hypothetical protein